VVRSGKDMTLLAWGAQVGVLESAATLVAEEGIDCEVIDLCTLAPWDQDTVANSVKKTGRLLINHEAPITGGFAGEIAACIQSSCFLSLEAPIVRVCGLDTPYPLCHEKEYMPDHLKTAAAIRASMTY
jgi:2-oxoisovalerate dehydrogenase E1 component beta subunit